MKKETNMEQTIKINVPDGFHTVWSEKKQKIEFVKIKNESWEDIKTFDDVLRYLGISKNEFEIAQSGIIPISKWQLIMKAFIKASNDELTLTTGDVYYPYCYIVWKNRATEEENERKVRDCIINDREAFLVGGRAYYGSGAGLGFSYSDDTAAYSYASFGFRAFSSREVAEHVARYFSKELIEETIGWRTDEIKWL